MTPQEEMFARMLSDPTERWAVAFEVEQQGRLAAEAEVQRLRGLLGEAAWYVDHYGDYRKDRQYFLRFDAAARGKPEPSEGEEDDEH